MTFPSALTFSCPQGIYNDLNKVIVALGRSSK